MGYLVTIRNTPVLLILLAVLSSLSGCSTWIGGSFQKPDIQLVDVELVHAKLLEQQFILHFRVDNPNSQSLPIHSINYRVMLNDTPLATGSNNQWLTVPSNSHAYFKIPVHTNLWRHMKVIVRMLEKPNQPIHYALHADVKTGLVLGKKINIVRHGDIIPGDYIRE
ncbi:MAG TPA: LEA type 2 family protein [Thiopseudomonas sp.]|nr:LEA type 2 family protein [Thiopseudomonas sp.]